MSSQLTGATSPTGVPQLEISGSFVRTARIADEWYRDVEDPAALVEECRRLGNVDVFTFWQRLPFTEPQHDFPMEWDSLAVLPISTFDHWYKRQINNKTRNLIVKARKKGIVVNKAVFDEPFVNGITRIFNETPIRQERPFIHYGKTAATIQREFSRFLFREEILGAYLDEELVGFSMIADAGRYALLGQIISMIQHRDKSPTNALICDSVALCAERGFQSLVYALWPTGSLADFKKHNGFECVRVPRYFIPLTARGHMALKLSLHRKMADVLPESTVMRLKALRSQFYHLRYR
jgi:hypothetical protein